MRDGYESQIALLRMFFVLSSNRLRQQQYLLLIGPAKVQFCERASCPLYAHDKGGGSYVRDAKPNPELASARDAHFTLTDSIWLPNTIYWGFPIESWGDTAP